MGGRVVQPSPARLWGCCSRSRDRYLAVSGLLPKWPIAAGNIPSQKAVDGQSQRLQQL